MTQHNFNMWNNKLFENIKTRKALRKKNLIFRTAKPAGRCSVITDGKAEGGEGVLLGNLPTTIVF